MLNQLGLGDAVFRQAEPAASQRLAEGTAAASGISRPAGVATMNALADMCWQRRAHSDADLRIGVDAYDAADIRAGEQVVVVGPFVLFLKSLKRAHQPYT